MCNNINTKLYLVVFVLKNNKKQKYIMLAVLNKKNETFNGIVYLSERESQLAISVKGIRVCNVFFYKINIGL